MVAANRWAEMQLSEDAIVVPAYLRDDGVHSVDFLKIDVDGADFEILNSFDVALDTVGILGVGIEVNYFGSTCDTEHTFHNVDRFMKARGFELFNVTVRRYSVASLPSRYIWKLPAQSEFGRPLQGDALYIRDLGSHEHDEVAARLPVTKLLNLICIFAVFNLPDCAAEIAMRFKDRLDACCDVNRILDLLAAQAQGPVELPLAYREYIRRFESHDPMFFPPSEVARRVEDEVDRLHVDAEKDQGRGTSAERSLHTLDEEPLASLQKQLQTARERITAMESSKFWKLRQAWFLLKRKPGVGANQ